MLVVIILVVGTNYMEDTMKRGLQDRLIFTVVGFLLSMAWFGYWDQVHIKSQIVHITGKKPMNQRVPFVGIANFDAHGNITEYNIPEIPPETPAP